MSQTFLITGGAGFLGINLVRYLLARGHRVRSLDIAPFNYPERPLVEVHTGDIRDKAVVDRAMVGVDQVVHTAAALPSTSRPTSFRPISTAPATSCNQPSSTASSGSFIFPPPQCTASRITIRFWRPIP